ncbi:substrate-binding domain-containing protein [Actinomadura sp. B10D3]|uniref:substrate-binding domain-containing protein n=1 Tax=Actinomadura sp. B10D3 TaxID=3153557 RepID=UPI00325FB4C6
MTAALAAIASAGCAGQTKEGPGGDAAGPAPVETKSVTTAREVDVASWCGDKRLKIGLADGFGGNAWRLISKEVVRQEAAKCPALDTDILYANADGDQQKANSDISGLVAQGVNVLLVYPDFGQAQLPALRAAAKAGVTVIPYDAAAGGKPGTDYTATTIADTVAGGEDLADWVGRTVKSGNVVFLGGIPGAPTSEEYISGIKRRLAKYPDVKLLLDKPVVTNWNKVDAQKAVTGLIAKYPRIDAVITDYGVTAVAAVDAFRAAGKKVPAIASLATNNELGCVWKKAGSGSGRFEIFSIDSTNDMAQLALRQGVAAANGKPVTPVQLFRLPVFTDSTAGKNPPCDPSLPPDADLSSPLDTAGLKATLR